MKNAFDDSQLDKVLGVHALDESSEHARRLRTSILVAAHTAPRFSWSGLFGFRPAFLVATGLLGVLLGVTVPSSGDRSAAAVLEDQPASFLTGDLG